MQRIPNMRLRRLFHVARNVSNLSWSQAARRYLLQMAIVEYQLRVNYRVESLTNLRVHDADIDDLVLLASKARHYPIALLESTGLDAYERDYTSVAVVAVVRERRGCQHEMKQVRKVTPD
jgi:hypothetical protein